MESKAFRTRAGRGKPGGGFTSSNLTRFSSFKALAIKQNWSLEDEFTFININRKSA